MQSDVSRSTSVDGDRAIERTLVDALAWARDRDYTGWDYADGMSSRIRRWLPVENKWLNLAFQESAKRAPVNVRPLLLVERRRNFKGAALFAMANLSLHRHRAARDGGHASDRDGRGGDRVVADDDRDASGDVDYADEATRLLDWLIQHRCRGYSGFCGSHRHELQTLSGKSDTNSPSIVSTAYPVRAFLAAADLDPVYPAVARTAADFVLADLAYTEVEQGARIKYNPTSSDDHVTPNGMALGARLLLDLYAHFGDDAAELVEPARKVLDLIASLQRERGGWTYRVPASSSHLSMDNFHNGYVVEAYLRYRDVVGDGRYTGVLEEGLSFYRNVLFEESGAPNWDESRRYPRDVHSCAQGVVVFTYAGDRAFARRILEWTLDTLYAGDGRFYYREHRLFTKRITLMRWCQAWMAYAMAEYLTHRPDGPAP